LIKIISEYFNGIFEKCKLELIRLCAPFRQRGIDHVRPHIRQSGGNLSCLAASYFENLNISRDLKIRTILLTDKLGQDKPPTGRAKQFLATISLLALLCGCDRNKGETVTAKPPGPQQAATGFSTAPPGKNPANHALLTGERTYRNTCSICHRLGLRGAPRLGDRDDWMPRLAKGREILYQHAIEGYQGSKGFMPSRGSNAKLSGNEVKAAVDYMLWHSIPAPYRSLGSHMLLPPPG